MDKFAMAHILDDTILKPIEAVIAGAYAQGRNVLYKHEVYAVLSTLGLNTPNHFLVRNEKEITDSLLYCVYHIHRQLFT